MSKIFTANILDKRVQEICNNDPIFAELIKKIGSISIEIRSTYFESLIMSIIGQQLSAKAASTIRSRVKSLVEEFTPELINQLETEDFRSVGVSTSKTTYIKDLSKKIIEKDLNLSELHLFDNNQVIKTLTSVRGIGKWTAEMFLIFSLGRIDVLSIGDAGLQRATKWLYNMEERADGNYLIQHSEKWKPYYSIASLYLWEAIDKGFVDSGKMLNEINDLE